MPHGNEARLRRRGSPLALAAVCLLAAACGGSDETSTAEPTATEPVATVAEAETPEPTAEASPTATDGTSPTAGATPTPIATPTSLPTPTPSPTEFAEPECNASYAGAPVRQSVRFVEADGDSGQDILTVYAVGDEAAPSQWRIRVEAGTGAAYDSSLEVSGPNMPVSAIGGGDIDQDGRDELFSVVGTGASATIVAVHTIVGCDLVPLTIDATALEAPVGASVGTMAGITCTDEGTLVLWTAEAVDADEGLYDVTGREYELTGPALTKLDDLELLANTGDIDFVYGELSCHGLTIVGTT